MKTQGESAQATDVIVAHDGSCEAPKEILSCPSSAREAAHTMVAKLVAD
jgi:hypothetical protein